MRLRLLLAVALVSIPFFGCSPKTVTTLVHDDRVLHIHLEREIGKDKRPIDAQYQHPLSLTDSDMVRLLQSIHIRRSAGTLAKLFSGPRPDQEPAFSDEEIQRMAGPLSSALTRATSADRINFRFEHRHSLFRGGLTTGVLFVKDDRLQIILGNYRYIAPAMISDSSVELDNPLNTRDSGVATLVPGSFQTLHETDHRNLKNRWLLIDFKSLLQNGEKAPSVVPPPETETILEERLRSLKRLRDEGLITEEEYSQKKQDLLRGF